MLKDYLYIEINPKMNKEKCNILLAKLVDAAKKDYEQQVKEEGREGKFTSDDYSVLMAEAHPSLIKASHLRNARSARSAIEAGKKPNSMVPCSAVQGFLIYLLHDEGDYAWPRVRKLVSEEGEEYKPLLEVNVKHLAIDASLVHALSGAVQETDLKEGSLGEFVEKTARIIAKAGKMISKAERNSSFLAKKVEEKTTQIDILMGLLQKSEERREKAEMFDETLKHLSEVVRVMETGAKSLKGGDKKKAEEMIKHYKQIIYSYSGT